MNVVEIRRVVGKTEETDDKRERSSLIKKSVKYMGDWASLVFFTCFW